MAYSAPRTWTPGEVPTAAQFNQDLRDNPAFLANPPACHVGRTTDQTINNTTVTNVLWTTEQFDTDTMHSTSVSTERITIKTAGIYIVTANILWGADTDWVFAASFIQLGGATNLGCDMVGSFVDGAIGAANSVAVVRKFAVNDYLSVAAFMKNTSGGSNLVLSASSFSACWIGLG